MWYEYPLILLALLLVTVFLHKYFQIKLFNNKKQIIYFYTLFFIIGTIWDNFAIYRGHWFYPGTGIMGIFIGLMPLEDYFFLLITSYFGLVLYQLFRKVV